MLYHIYHTYDPFWVIIFKTIHQSITTSSTSKTMADGSPTHVRILVVSDVDIRSAARLAEFAIHDPDFSNSLTADQRDPYAGVDLCIACGPFGHNDHPSEVLANTTSETPRVRTREEEAASEGFMTCALSQLENIVCRLLYVPCQGKDPRSTCLDNGDDHHMRLTPNSRNVHNRMLKILKGIDVIGISTKSGDDDQILECLRETMNEFLGQNRNDIVADAADIAEDALNASRSIIICNAPYLYSSNIHPSDDSADDDNNGDTSSSLYRRLDSPECRDGVMMYIMTGCREGAESYVQCETSLGDLKVVTPGSLRLRGEFALVDIGRQVGGKSACSSSSRRWSVEKIHLRNMRRRYENSRN